MIKMSDINVCCPRLEAQRKGGSGCTDTWENSVGKSLTSIRFHRNETQKMSGGQL